jgi:hypothetical protein
MTGLLELFLARERRQRWSKYINPGNPSRERNLPREARHSAASNYGQIATNL